LTRLRDGAIQQRATGFTQLWVLPASAAKEDSVRLGVSNHEPGRIGYRLLVTASGTIIGSWPHITLGPDEQWEATIALPTAQPAAATVEAALYRLDAPDTAYRRVLFRREDHQSCCTVSTRPTPPIAACCFGVMITMERTIEQSEKVTR